MSNKQQKETDADKLLKKAEGKIGCSYQSGGTGPNSFDCSGFVQWCHAQIGITVPRTSSEQYDQGSSANGEKGSLVFCKKNGKINLSCYLYNFAIGLNEGIEGIKKISEYFEESYQKKDNK